MRQVAALVPGVALSAGLGVLAARVHPLAPVAVLAALVIGAVAFQSAFTLLCAFVMVLFLRPAEIVPALAVLRPALLFAGASLVLVVLLRLVTRDVRWPTSGHTPWMLALTFAVFASSVLGTTPGHSMAVFQDVFVKIVLLYVLILLLVDSPERAAAMQTVIALSCATLGIYALVLKLSGQATIEGSRAGFVGLLGDPNDLALTLLMSFPFLVEASRVSRGAARAVFVFCLCAVVAGILSTQSRGGLLGIGGAFWLLSRHWIASVSRRALVLGLVGAVAFAAAGVSKRHSGGADTEGLDESAQGRLDAWKAGGRMLMRRPVLGVGFSAFQDNYAAYASNAVIWGKHEAHNSFVKAAAETGFAGLVPFVALAARSMWVGFRLLRRRRDGRDAGLAGAAADALLPTLVAFFVAAFFLSQCWNWFTYVLIALSATYERTWLAEASAGRPTNRVDAVGALHVPR